YLAQFNCQVGLDVQFFRIGETQISKDIVSGDSVVFSSSHEVSSLHDFLPMQFLGALQALADQIKIAPIGGDTVTRLFLEAMQHIDRFRKSNGVNRAVCIPIVVLDYLQNTCAAETSQWLRIRMLLAELGNLQGKADVALGHFRKVLEIVIAASNPDYWL